MRLLSEIVERMELKELFATYCKNGRNEYSPKVLLKICVYGYMRKILSSRELEKACRENINFMYLLDGKPVPDHNTIARFRSAHLSKCQDEIQAAMTRVLMDMGEVSFDRLFSFCVAGKDIAGKECALITCCEEHDMAVMDGVRVPIERSAALLKWKMVGEFLVPGAFNAGTIAETDGCAQTAALAEKF